MSLPNTHHPAYYYSAAYAFCKMDHFFRSSAIERELKPVRYHLLTGIQTRLTGNAEPDKIETLERKAEQACAPLNKLLWDDKQYLDAIVSAAAVLKEIAGDQAIDRDFGRTRDFTDHYMKALLAK
jgi:hypothetical protein